MSQGPVFIAGLAFSGKTPLRIAMSAHSGLHLTRRTAMWSTYHGRFGDLAITENRDRCLTQLLADPAIAALRPDRAEIERRFAAGPPTYARLFATIHQQHANRQGKRRWGDQMGMLEGHADLLLTSFADGRMIHMIRDPRARYRAAAHAHRQLPGKLGWETARWRHSAELALRNRHHHPDRYRIVRYERLCADPEATLRDVCAFIGEDYEPGMAEALRGTVPDDAADADDDVARGSDAVSEFVERHAWWQLLDHDYAVAVDARRRKLSLSFYLIDLPCNRAGIAMWQLARSNGRRAREAA